jgi:hypothetical protein
LEGVAVGLGDADGLSGGVRLGLTDPVGLGAAVADGGGLPEGVAEGAPRAGRWSNT